MRTTTFLVLAVGLSVAGCAAQKTTPRLGPGGEPAVVTGDLKPWDGPLVCMDEEGLVIENALIDVAGEGPTVQGTCKIRIVNTRIIAGRVGLLVNGGGEIEIANSEVTGQDGAMHVKGSGNIVAKDSVFAGGGLISGSGNISAERCRFVHGRISRTGSGEFEDKGGNTWKMR